MVYHTRRTHSCAQHVGWARKDSRSPHHMRSCTSCALARAHARAYARSRTDAGFLMPPSAPADSTPLFEGKRTIDIEGYCTRACSIARVHAPRRPPALAPSRIRPQDHGLCQSPIFPMRGHMYICMSVHTSMRLSAHVSAHTPVPTYMVWLARGPYPFRIRQSGDACRYTCLYTCPCTCVHVSLYEH